MKPLAPEESPAPATGGEPRHLGDTALLALATAGIVVAGLGAYPLWGPDEGRHAEIARRLGEAGSWLVPRVYGAPYYDKPVLFYWILRSSFALFGVSELAARLPSAIAAIATVVLIHRFALPRIGRRGAAAASLVLATAPLAVVFGRFCNLDATLCLLITAACLAWLSWLEAPRAGPPWGAYLAMGLGTLLKGPVAIALPALMAAAVALADGRPFALLRRAGPIRGALVVAAVAVPWYAAAAVADPDYVRTFLVEHNFHRYVSPTFVHARSPLYFAAVLPGVLLPWPLIVPAALGVEPARGRARRAERDALLWAAVVVVFFSIGRAKLPSYVLPAVPAIALWLGSRLARLGPDQGQRLRLAVAAWAGLLAAAAVALPIYAWLSYPDLVAPSLGGAAAAVVALGGLRLAWRRPEVAATPLLAASTAALFAAFYLGAAPAISPYASDVALARAAALRPGIPAVAFRVQPATFSFYSGRIVPRIDSLEEMRERLRAGPLLVVTRRRQLGDLAAAGATLRPWADNGRHLLLGTEPRPRPGRSSPDEARSNQPPCSSSKLTRSSACSSSTARMPSSMRRVVGSSLPRYWIISR